MRPLLKLNTLVFSITTAIIFFLWGYIQTLIISYPIKGLMLGFVIAIGTYRAVLTIFLLINKISNIKKILFGSYYMEGIWIGCYLNKSKEPVFFIEMYEQGFDRLIVRGRSYSDNGSYKGSWTSDNVSLDTEKGKITYTYITNFMNNSHINQGIAEFTILRDNANKAPHCLMGFTSDLYNPEKIKSYEIKVKHKKNYSDNKLLEDAKKFYNDNKSYFS